LEVLEVCQYNMALLPVEMGVLAVHLHSTVLPLQADLEVLVMVLPLSAQLEMLEFFLRSMVLLVLAGLAVPLRSTLPVAGTTTGVEATILRKTLCP
jgi:hypothetical protein